MRLWTLHPKYLDSRGLVAAWREGLLAQAVLRGRTRGYTRHPQLIRFRRQKAPVRCIVAYLTAVHEEATRRGYCFDASRLARSGPVTRIEATRGQMEFEWKHLRAKLRVRSPGCLQRLSDVTRPQAHPLFQIVPGETETWERGAPATDT